MATRTIRECDRCRHEIKGTVNHIGVGGKTLDMCNPCRSKLDRFLSGEELEVPP